VNSSLIMVIFSHILTQIIVQERNAPVATDSANAG
jgi:hypothetical protein